jgi:hypothetical protein
VKEEIAAVPEITVDHLLRCGCGVRFLDECDDGARLPPFYRPAGYNRSSSPRASIATMVIQELSASVQELAQAA